MSKCKYGKTGVCGKLFSPNCHDSEECSEFELYTNADHIRAMSDEELAEFLCDFRACDMTDHPCDGCVAKPYCHEGHRGTIDWLSQPWEGDASE